MHKKRQKRQFAKNFIVYCEGDTERHYIDGMRRWLHEVDSNAHVRITPIDVGGGGYGAILHRLKKDSDSNCLARFVLVDFDRYRGVEGEAIAFKRLVEYSNNSRGKLSPCILVVSNKNFEYTLCFHDERYKGQDATAHLRSSWGYRTLDDCKADVGVWDRAHRGARGHDKALNCMEGRHLVLENTIVVDPKHFGITLKRVRFDESCEHILGVNLGDLFKVVRFQES